MVFIDGARFPRNTTVSCDVCARRDKLRPPCPCVAATPLLAAAQRVVCVGVALPCPALAAGHAGPGVTGGSRLGLLLPSPQPPSGLQRETDCAPNQGRGWSPGSLLPVRLTASADIVTAASPCASPRRPPSLLPCHRGAFHKVTPATQPRGPGPLPTAHGVPAFLGPCQDLSSPLLYPQDPPRVAPKRSAESVHLLSEHMSERRKE